MEIRRLCTGEGAAIRELRLRALQDAPYAFSASLADEVDDALSQWEGRLLDAATDWARGRGAARLELSVSDRAAEAAQLYAARGFQPTGEIRPLPSDTSATEISLALPL